MPSPSKARALDRRKVNSKVVHERRGSGRERRNACPQCGSAVMRQLKRTKTGTVTTLLCTRCEYSRASEQVDAEVLLSKLTWCLPLERRGGLHHLPFPHELVETLGLAEGDQLVLSPVTSTLGSMDMRWMIEIKKRQGAR